MQIVLLDACVLIPPTMSDLILRLAEAGVFDPRWSEPILVEVRDHLEARGIAPGSADSRVEAMRQAFPVAVVEDVEASISSMTNHPKDRHVLAAAVVGRATAIMTMNLRDFPPSALSPWGIEARHPDDLLTEALTRSPDTVLSALRRLQAHYRRPPVAMNEILDRLERSQMPRFATDAKQLLDHQPER